ncbi:MAG: hypothetical protein WAS33_08115 [Candidatus Promineifilaceae bacterium]|nr:hypothetical protein [Anaerolineaceae bacterium]
MTPDIWDQWSLRVLITFGLVLAGFLPLLYSVRETFFAKDKQSQDENE